MNTSEGNSPQTILLRKLNSDLKLRYHNVCTTQVKQAKHWREFFFLNTSVISDITFNPNQLHSIRLIQAGEQLMTNTELQALLSDEYQAYENQRNLHIQWISGAIERLNLLVSEKDADSADLDALNEILEVSIAISLVNI